MKTSYRATALLLCLALIFSLCACGGGTAYSSATYGRYKTLAGFGGQQFSIGVRSGDNLRYYIDAGLKALAADGSFHSIALQWFAEDPVTFQSDNKALEALGDIPPRELIVGVDGDAFPMSYADGDNYSGFDVDCARALCARLGWSVKFIPIKAGDAYVELSSGNVDVVWGGMVLDTATKDYTVLATYMTNELVLLTLESSGIRSAGGLKGKTLAIDVDQKYMDALNTDAALRDSLGQITRLTGGAQKCFEALDSGAADAIIVYSAAARYYGK